MSSVATRDVAEGCYYVLVIAAGYEDKVSPVVGVPPTVTDLHLKLTSLATPAPKLYLPLLAVSYFGPQRSHPEVRAFGVHMSPAPATSNPRARQRSHGDRSYSKGQESCTPSA